MVNNFLYLYIYKIMPYAYRKIRNQEAYKVFNKMSGVIHSNHTTLDNAKKQIRLLSALDKNGKGMESNLYTDAKLGKMSDAQLIALKTRATDPQLWDRIRRIIESRQLPPAATTVAAQPQAPINLFGLVNPQPERPRPPVQELIVKKKPSTPTPPPSKKSKGGKGVKKGKGAGSSKPAPVPEISEESKKRVEELKKQIAAIEEGNLKKAEEITKKIAKKRKEDRAKIAKEDPGYEVEGGEIRTQPPSEVKPLPPPPAPAQVVAQFRAPDGRIIEVTGQHNIDLLRRNPDYQIIQRGGAMDPLITLILAAISAGSLGALYESYMRLRNNQVVPEEIATELERINIPLGSVVPIVDDIYVRMEEGSLPEALVVEIRQAAAAVPSGIPAARAEVVGRGLPVGEIQQFLKNSYQIPPAASIGDFMLDKKLSGRRVQVYKNRNTPQAVVVHRGTQGTKDWATDIYYATGGDPKNSARFKHAAEVQKKAEDKYGANNITTLGHSIGSKIASAVGQNSKEIINLNKAVSPLDAIQKTSEKEINIRTSRDPVSALLPLRNSDRTITIPSETLNPFTEHKTDVLGRLPANQIIGVGVKKMVNRLKKTNSVVPYEGRMFENSVEVMPTIQEAEDTFKYKDLSIGEITTLIQQRHDMGDYDNLKDPLKSLIYAFDVKTKRGYGVKRGGAITPLENTGLITSIQPLTPQSSPEEVFDVRRRFIEFFNQNVDDGMSINQFSSVAGFIRSQARRIIGDVNTGGFGVNNNTIIDDVSRAILDDLDSIPSVTYDIVKFLFDLNIYEDQPPTPPAQHYGELQRKGVLRPDRTEDGEYRISTINYLLKVYLDDIRSPYLDHDMAHYTRPAKRPRIRGGSLAKIISPPIKKMEDPWVEHIKMFAAKKGINYAQAMKHPDIKKGYKKGGMIKSETTAVRKQIRPLTTAEKEDILDYLILAVNHIIPERKIQLLIASVEEELNGGIIVVDGTEAQQIRQLKRDYLSGINTIGGEGMSRIKKSVKRGGMMGEDDEDDDMAELTNNMDRSMSLIETGRPSVAVPLPKTRIIRRPELQIVNTPPPAVTQKKRSSSKEAERSKKGKGCCMGGMGMRAVAVRGRGMPTIREAAIAEAYNESQLGANGGRGYISL